MAFFVVLTSPVAKDEKLKGGDHLITVDGHSLACVPHSAALTMLKQRRRKLHSVGNHDSS